MDSSAQLLRSLSETSSTLLTLATRASTALKTSDIDRQAVLSQIQQQIQQALAFVQNTCNALVPIHRLPPEVLCMIFVRVIDRPRGMAWNYPHQNLRSIQLVCRLWRQLAISCPPCWSHIDADDMMSSSELHMLLGRAGGLPLHFSCDCSDGLLEYIIPHMDRVQTLQVILEADPVEDLTPCGIFFKSAPLLEALHISSSDLGQPHANVPTLFNDCAPRLSRLFLSQYFVCATNRFPSLTHLYLHAQYTFSPESLSQFLDFLDGSPMLEELVFESAGPCVVSVLLDVFPLPRTVALRRLRSLVFLECFWAVPACILRHVVPGPHVEIKIKELQQLYRSTELFSIFAEGAAFLRHLDIPTQLSLWCPERHFYMQCATPSASVTLDITFHSCLPGSEQGTLVSTLLVELPNVLRLAGVTDFRMRVDRAAHIWSPAVRTFHSALPAVEAYTLWLDPELNKRYWRAILASKLHAPIFPRLRALHVVGALPITWRPYWAMGLAISWAKHGRPLDDLTFTVVSASPCMVTLAKWDPERVHIGGQRVSDFVKKLQFRGVAYGASGMSLPLIKGWDGRVEV